MGVTGGPNIIRDSSLVLTLDAADRNSYTSGSTDWYDLSGNNNNARIVATGSAVSASYTTNNIGGITFSGTGSYGIINDSNSLRVTSFTLDAWFKPASFSQYNVILCKPYTQAPWIAPYLSYMMRLNTNGSIYEVSTNNNNYIYIYQNYTFSVGVLYNMSFTYNNTTGIATAYLNGNSIVSQNIGSGNILYSGYPTLIGAGHGSSPAGEFFKGDIYSTKIYNRILNSSEIRQNYNALKTRFK
jgi:hypothetical protein